MQTITQTKTLFFFVWAEFNINGASYFIIFGCLTPITWRFWSGQLSECFTLPSATKIPEVERRHNKNKCSSSFM